MDWPFISRFLLSAGVVSIGCPNLGFGVAWVVALLLSLPVHIQGKDALQRQGNVGRSASQVKSLDVFVALFTDIETVQASGVGKIVQCIRVLRAAVRALQALVKPRRITAGAY